LIHRKRSTSDGISHTAQTTAHATLEQLQKRLIASRSKAIAGKAAVVVAELQQQQQQKLESTLNTAVFRVSSVGSDGRAMKILMDEVQKAAPALSFLGICADEQAQKIAVFAVVTPEMRAQGLQANQWVVEAMRDTGGKGGGKADAAQGSVPGHSQAVVEQMMRQSRLYSNQH
jgi:alanyl-tRNA synthetase